MAHHCIDWSASPPARKVPLLVLTRGNEHIYTAIPKELKTLEQVARREFNLGDDAEVTFLSACANLCNGRPARITEDAWEYLSPFIGCATVNISGAQAGPAHAEEQRVEEQVAVPRGNLKRKLAADADDGDEDENEYAHERSGRELESHNQPNDADREAVRSEPADAPLPDHGNEQHMTVAEDQREEPPTEKARMMTPRKSRVRRRLMESHYADDEGEGGDEALGRESQVPAGSQAPPPASPLKLSQPEIKIKREKDNRYLSQTDTDSAEPSELVVQTANSSTSTQRNCSDSPVKQEKGQNGVGNTNRPDSLHGTSQLAVTESLPEVGTQPQAEPSEYHKLMIRVAHRPSQQESKFTTKSTTKVAKVLASACKSFGLEASRATLYLIVITEEDGGQENLFPCDKNDSIARAGAERNTESKFVLKMEGEV